MLPAKKIFIVEPNEDLQKLYTLLFSIVFENVNIAFGNENDISEAIKFRPDIIIMEINGAFPYRPESVFLRYLAAIKDGSLNCEIVIITTIHDSAVEHYCLISGAAAYLKKPVSNLIILDTVRKYIP